MENKIVGISTNIQEVKSKIAEVANTDLLVLIRGETGTGKDLIAQVIHESSSRVNKPFFTYNCATGTEQMIESELFGHTKGAFTGAISEKKGFFENANGGTLFLNEIGNMPMRTQELLLTVLDKKEIYPSGSGGGKKIKVDVRIICATNGDLGKLIQESKFREDLYYRILGQEINIKPLRQSREDIVHLVSYFVNKGSKSKIEIVSKLFLEYLINYSWPGNIRELETMIEILVKTNKTKLTVADIPSKIKDNMDKLFNKGIAWVEETEWLNLDEISSFESKIWGIYWRRVLSDLNLDKCKHEKFIELVRLFDSPAKAEDEIKKYFDKYYLNLVEECNDNAREAAGSAGFLGNRKNTFESRIKKLRNLVKK